MQGSSRSWQQTLALLAPPALGLVICLGYLAGGKPVADRARLALTVACLASLYALGISLVLVGSRRVASALANEARELEKQARYHESRNRVLQSQVEILAAMREVSRAASGEVTFEEIFKQVLIILEDLFGAEEITIYLHEDASPNLQPKAHRTPQKTSFGKDIDAAKIDDSGVSDALKFRTIISSMEDSLLSFAAPLDSDQGPIGVMKICLELEGAPTEQAEKAERVERMLKELSRHISLAVKTTLLQDQAHSDTMTGLFNKGYFLDQLPRSMHFARRKSGPLSLLMLDIDHFKPINDTYGHLTGDKILVELARLLKNNLRKYDTAYRYGGEELTVILPDATLAQALKLAERIRKKVHSRRFRGESNQRIRVTVSIGVAELTADISEPKNLIDRADRALYKAKESGRNQVQTLDAQAA